MIILNAPAIAAPALPAVANCKQRRAATSHLQAEREQGITIDVAYRFSTTKRRSLVVPFLDDNPGIERV
jgi:hypothetical protein